MASDEMRAVWEQNARWWERVLAERAQNDPIFRQEVLTDPKSIILREINSVAADNLKVPGEVQFYVHENTASIVHRVEPPTALSELDDSTDAQIIEHRSSDTVCHFVIPNTPVAAFEYEGELSDTELEMVAAGSSVQGPTQMKLGG